MCKIGGLVCSVEQGRVQDFKLGGGGAHLKKLRRAEGGAKFLGISCGKSPVETLQCVFVVK